MISFLNTLILYALPTIAIPLLIHLFTKQKMKKILFSSLEFLKEMQKENIRSVRLKQILLIVIRTLIILMIVLAFARPAIRKMGLGSNAGGSRSSIVIILDNSMSMAHAVNGSQLFDFAKDKAFELVEALKPGDEVYLMNPVYPGNIPVVGPKYNFETIKQNIQTTSLSDYATDLVGAIREAQNLLLQSENINREIYMISDFQAKGFHQQTEQLSPVLDSDIRLFLLPIAEKEYRNVAVQEIKLINQILERGKPAEVAVKITNWGNISEKNRLVQLLINGKRSSQTTIDLKPGETQVVSFKFTPDQVGFQSGLVLLEEDELSRDNQRFFSFFVPLEINVLLAGKMERDVRYFQWALHPSDDVASSLKPKFVAADQLSTVDFSPYQVVILSNVPDLRTSVVNKLKDYVTNGGGLIITLGSDVDIRAYNENINSKFNLPEFTDAVGRIGSTDAFISFGKVDFSHPIFHTLFEQDEKHVDSPKFFFSFKLSKNSQAEPIISYNNNYPFIIESKMGKGRILLLTTAVDPAWSDFAVKGIFAPLVNRCVSYLAGSGELQMDEIYVGNEIRFAGSQTSGQINLSIRTPDDRQIKVKPLISENKLVAAFAQTSQPGIYSLYNQNNLLGQWAINVAPDESDCHPMEMENLKQIEGEGTIIELKPDDDLQTQIYNSRFGKELWKIFLLIALGLIILEMLLFREKSNPSAADSMQFVKEQR